MMLLALWSLLLRPGKLAIEARLRALKMPTEPAPSTIKPPSVTLSSAPLRANPDRLFVFISFIAGERLTQSPARYYRGQTGTCSREKSLGFTRGSPGIMTLYVTVGQLWSRAALTGWTPRSR